MYKHAYIRDQDLTR